MNEKACPTTHYDAVPAPATSVTTAGYGVRVAHRGPRLVASDLDGTLLRSDGSVSDRTRDAVHRVEAAGALFVMVTARPPRWVDALADLTGEHGLAIVANGAILYDVAARKPLRTTMIEPVVALEVAESIRAEIPDVEFAIERANRYGKEPAYQNKWPMPADGLVAEITELLAEPAAKLLVRHPSWHSDELLSRVSAVVGDRVVASHSGGEQLVEISAAGVSKAAALAELAIVQGLSASDVVAFGDSLNDLPMLAWAGTAYAVANAHAQVLELVDRVCPANDEDGVAVVLEGLFPG